LVTPFTWAKSAFAERFQYQRDFRRRQGGA
jgi:hypothetical protein